jgi:hypothetical protein
LWSGQFEIDDSRNRVQCSYRGRYKQRIKKD